MKPLAMKRILAEQAAKRDPRMTPRAGDVLRLGKVRVRVSPCGVANQVFFELGRRQCQIDMRGWTDWCEAMDAEVIYQAETTP